jgi:peptidoglycan/LPS O-acetylase OafA/YrhL
MSLAVASIPAARTSPEIRRESRRPRIRVLDGLRLVAALLVVSWHYVAFGHGAALTPYAQVPALYPVAAYGWLGVELFFLISGFVISMSSIGHTLGEFVTSRITRLYPAYWFAILLTTAVLLIWPVADSALSLRDVAVNLTMMQSGVGIASVDAVYWTLWVELHFYVLFSLVVWRGVTLARASLFCGAWLAISLLADVASGGVGSFLSAVLMPMYAPFFVAGVAFFLMHRFGQRPILWLYVVASFAMGVPSVLQTLHGSNSHLHEQIARWPAVLILAGFFALIALIALNRLRADWKWLGVAGAMTYPLYLVHEFIGWTILRSLDSHVPGPLLYAGTVTLMLVVAWLIHRYVEKPVAARVRTLLSLLRRRRPQPAADAGTRSIMSDSRGPVSSIVTGAPVASSTVRMNSASRGVTSLAEREPRIAGS